MKRSGVRYRKLTPAERFLGEGVKAINLSDGHLVVLVDLQSLFDYRKRFSEQHGFKPSLTAIFMRASVLTLQKYPQGLAQWSRKKLIIPETIDIGVSIESDATVNPVVVVRETENKTLRQLHDDLIEGSRLALEKEAKDRELFNRLGRFIPAWLAACIIRWFVNNPWVVRNLTGNFHITNVGTFGGEIGVPSFLSPSLQLCVGSIKERPIVEKGNVVARQSAYFCLNFDHRVMSGRLHAQVIMAIKGSLEAPGPELFKV